MRMLVWVSVAPLGYPVVPDVYWMLIGSPGLSPDCTPRQRLGVDGGVGDLLPGLPADDDHVAQRRAPSAHIVEHRRVVGALERRRREHRAHRRLVQRVLQLVGPVCGIDVDQDRADLRGGVLDHRPLRAVRRPDPDAVPRLGAAFDQRGGDPAGRLEELGIGPASARRAFDHRLAVRECRGRSGEVVADRFVEQRRAGGSGVVGQHATGSLHRGFSAITGYPDTVIRTTKARVGKCQSWAR